MRHIWHDTWTSQVSQYQKGNTCLDFTEARQRVIGSGISSHIYKSVAVASKMTLKKVNEPLWNRILPAWRVGHRTLIRVILTQLFHEAILDNKFHLWWQLRMSSCWSLLAVLLVIYILLPTSITCNAPYIHSVKVFTETKYKMYCNASTGGLSHGKNWWNLFSLAVFSLH